MTTTPATPPTSPTADPAPTRLLQRLADESHQRHAAGVHRRLHPRRGDGLTIDRDGRTLVNLSSNDYLGLAQHPHLIDAAARAVRDHGTGSGASALAGGYSESQHALERRFAAFKHADAAVLLPTGFAANLALLTTLARPGDLIAADALNHASLIDAAKLSGATLRTFPHPTPADPRGYDKLERLLERHAADPATADAVRLVVTDAVFSMDGDTADLRRLADLAAAHDAALIVDEAHATAVLGQTGAGLIEAQGVAGRVTAAVSTASKALGGLGGLITASPAIVEAVINRGRSLIYSTAPPPAQIAAIDAALDVVADEPDRRRRVQAIAAQVRDAIGLPTPDPATVTPIVPWIAGTPDAAARLADTLADAGFAAPVIRPPTVKPGTSRVRLSLRADLTEDHVARLCATLAAATA
ncbi:MAG: 8-amino-7-oxononanoate synthase [Planctomycetota bacterium]